MSKRAYGQYCGVSRALEMVGDRWTLLIVRDLLVSPKRYTDLRAGLPRIPTNILSDRLKELERSGVVRRRILPRPEGSIVYELTEYGAELEDVVIELGRWGAQALAEPGEDEIVTPDSLVMALRTTFQPDAAAGLHVGYELHIADIVLHARVDDGMLRAAPGPLPDADLVIEPGTALRALMTGELDPGEAIAGGHVQLTGDPELLARFAELFRIRSRHRAVAR